MDSEFGVETYPFVNVVPPSPNHCRILGRYSIKSARWSSVLITMMFGGRDSVAAIRVFESADVLPAASNALTGGLRHAARQTLIDE